MARSHRSGTSSLYQSGFFFLANVVGTGQLICENYMIYTRHLCFPATQHCQRC
uniref:Uncharacterized protein n=1 Tax=Anguilla anguilla TaxID=7936 RepID=A0A0E9X8N3_ANGAN